VRLAAKWAEKEEKVADETFIEGIDVLFLFPFFSSL
jgi:hypothetical protein